MTSNQKVFLSVGVYQLELKINSTTQFLSTDDNVIFIVDN